MKKEKKFVIFKTLSILAASAVLAAISIVLGKYLAIPVGEVMRFSFENLPIILAGMLFGAPVGTAVGACADLIGCVLVGYTVNPAVTAGACAIGFISGVVYRFLSHSPLSVRVTVSVISAHFLGSVIIKTLGLSAFYSIPFYALFLWRLLNYAIVGVLEGAILLYLLKNRTFMAEVNSILRKKK